MRQLRSIISGFIVFSILNGWGHAQTQKLSIPLDQEFRPPLASGFGAPNDELGHAVAIDGDTVVVTSVHDDLDGSAYVYKRDGRSWTLEAKLRENAPGGANLFGNAADVSGDTVIIGALQEDDPDTAAGSAYIFSRTNNTWSLQQKLVPLDAARNDQFGITVAVEGDTAVIGSVYDDDLGTDSGSAYVYTRSNTTWTLQQKLYASDGTNNAWFGGSVDISGNSIIVGAQLNNENGPRAGSAYVFTRSGTSWTEQQRLIANDGASEDRFGVSASLSGDYALVGARFDDDEGLSSGSAYVFHRSAGVWTQQDKLTAPDGEENDYFGEASALSGDTAVIGVLWRDQHSNTQAGTCYIFTRTGSNWNFRTSPLSQDLDKSDFFGFSVAIDGNTMISGAPREDADGDQSGSAYAFTGSGSSWTQEYKFTGGYARARDFFGTAVTVSGDTLAVAADAADDTGINAGRAYVYHYDGTNWQNQAELIGADSGADDFFGDALALHGETLVVGAPGYDSSIKSNIGAGYVFLRSSSNTWHQTHQLLPDSGPENALFGTAVAMDAETLIIGAGTDGEAASRAGAVYIYYRSGTAIWDINTKLFASDASADDVFGFSVGIDGDTAVVSAAGADAVYVFTGSGRNWSEQQKIVNPADIPSHGFGNKVAISGELIAVGANGTDVNGGNSGSVYIFRRQDGVWSLAHQINGANSQWRFGDTFALRNNTLLAGQRLGFLSIYTWDGTTWTEQQRAPGSATFLPTALALTDEWALVGRGGTTGFDTAGAPVPEQGVATVFRMRDLNRLTVAGATALPGSSLPIPHGTNYFVDGWTVTNTAQTATNAAGDTRFFNTGWTGSGSVPATGTSNQTSFVLSEDSTLTWQWNTQHRFAQSASTGSVFTATTTWLNAGAVTETLSAPEQGGTGLYFAAWEINGARVPGASSPAVNPATGILMNTGITAIAQYHPAGEDSNGDGLDDWFQQRYFGTNVVLATADGDLDGHSHREEQEALTDPTDGHSVFAILQVTSSPIQSEIQISTQPGRKYIIEYSDGSDWFPFADAQQGVGTWLSRNSSPFTFIDNYQASTSGIYPTNGFRRYRVQVTQP